MSDAARTAEPTALDTITTTALAELNEFDAELARFRARYADAVYDLTDPEVERQARSDRAAVSSVIGRLDRRHRAVKEPLLSATKALDGRRRELKRELESVRDGIRDQIDAHEQIERDRQAALGERVDAIRAMAPRHGEAATVLRERQEELHRITLDDSWDDFVADAQVAREEVGADLANAIEDAKRREAEQAELERLRAEAEQRAAEDAARLARERDERIAREAAEAARREADDEKERAIARARAEAEAAAEAAIRAEAELLAAAAEAEQRERDAAEQAERDRIAAIEAERARAERAAVEERARLEAERRGEEMAAVAQKREDEARKAKREHRHRIHIEALASLVDAGLDDGAARKTLDAIRSGDVRHIRFEY